MSDLHNRIMTFQEWWETESGWGGEVLSEGHLAQAAWEAGKLAAEHEAQNVCKWEYDKDEEFWNNSCGSGWSFMSGTPEDNNCKYCPNCGGKIVEADNG